MIGKRVLLFLLAVWFIPLAFADVSMTISPDQITQGESFTIQYQIQSRSEIEPDFSPLENEFTILGQHNSLQMTIVNGRSSTNITWVLTLIPKRFGPITIPPIRFGTEFSSPRDLDVAKANDVTLKRSRSRAFIQVSVDQKKPYVQSQVTYSIKMYYAINIARGSLNAPEINDTVSFRLTNDKQYQAYYNNQLYNVLERNFALFPQKSGRLEIPPATFSGVEQVRGTTNYAYTGRPLHLSSKKIRLTVEPIPVSLIGSTWLPASDLHIREAWSNIPSQLEVGTPITRTLIISAGGLTSAQLPDLGKGNVIGFNVYPSKAVTNDQVTDKRIIGQRKERITYIPSETGELSLPAIDVPWWNIKTHQMEVAHLDAHHFKVVPAVNSPSQASPLPAPKPINNQAFLNSVQQAPKTFAWFQFHYLIIALLIIWLVTFWLGYQFWRSNRRLRQESDDHQGAKKQFEPKAKRQLQRACEANDPVAAKRALFDWARYKWPNEPTLNLNQIAERLGSALLAAELQHLDQLLYANTGQAWQGAALWDAFTSIKMKKSRFGFRKKRPSQLPPLYPS